MKKILWLTAFTLALVAPRLEARPEGAWWYNQLILQANQSETITGPSTFVGSMTATGAASFGTAGTSTLAATGVAGSSTSVLGLFATPSTALGVAGALLGVNASTTVPVNSSFETIISSGGPITLTSLPNISTSTLNGGSTLIPDGTYLVLTSTTTNGITFQSNGGLAGSQLFLGAATRVVALHKTLVLQFFQNPGGTAFWEERAYVNANN